MSNLKGVLGGKLHDRLIEASNKSGLPMAEIVRRAIADWLKKNLY
jgi:hypothetical protein